MKLTEQERREAADIVGRFVRNGRIKIAPPLPENMTKQRALALASGLTSHGTERKRQQPQMNTDEHRFGKQEAASSQRANPTNGKP